VPEGAVFRRFLVAVGDSSCTDQLVTDVARLASTCEAEVLLVHVSDCNVCCGAMDHPALHDHEHELLWSLVESLAGRGVRSRSELRVTTSGRIAEHLLDAAAEWRADLLVAASGRSGRLRGRSWRRVLAKLLDDAACPVLVVPAAGRVDATAPGPDSESQTRIEG
jgi:nucleotide-binding universal stress UspA family protein